MNKEEEQLRKRLIELSNISDQRNIELYSDFLNLNELNILHTTPKNLFRTRFEIYGGYTYAERQMVSFLPDALYVFKEERSVDTYPICYLKITPLQKKFAERLSHRDYLGAVLNLGIDRSKIGDIIVLADEAVLIIHQSLADFVITSLQRIKHTAVKTAAIARCDFDYTPEYEEIKGTVATVRLDSLLGLAFLPSRSKMSAYITAAKVYVNGKLITSNGYQVQEGDVISVRGMGRFTYQGVFSRTKKDRQMVVIHKYI